MSTIEAIDNALQYIAQRCGGPDEAKVYDNLSAAKKHVNKALIEASDAAGMGLQAVPVEYVVAIRRELRGQ